MSEVVRLYQYKTLLSGGKVVGKVALLDALESWYATFKRDIAKQGISQGQLAQRIRLLQAGKRRVTLKNFEAVASATMGRKRIAVSHYNLQSGEQVQRTVSPQKLVYYRDNWYLNAWCHLRRAGRSGARGGRRAVAPRHALELRHFCGAPKAWAKLRFTPERARWVSRELWHPAQRSETEADGSYVLQVPYSDERELVGDILRFGAEVEVVEPADLRGRVKRALHEAAGRYV